MWAHGVMNFVHNSLPFTSPSIKYVLNHKTFCIFSQEGFHGNFFHQCSFLWSFKDAPFDVEVN